MNKYIDNAGFIDVRAIALDKRKRLTPPPDPDVLLQELNRSMAIYCIGCLLLTAAIFYWGM